MKSSFGLQQFVVRVIVNDLICKIIHVSFDAFCCQGTVVHKISVYQLTKTSNKYPLGVMHKKLVYNAKG